LATIDELADVLHHPFSSSSLPFRQEPGRSLDVYAVIWCPVHKPRNWNAGALAQALDSIPEAARVTDAGGEETTRFGVKTSGTILLYSGTGRLLFSGGITASRGHRGGNIAAETLRQRIYQSLWEEERGKKHIGAKDKIASFPVFGCGMQAGEKRDDRDD
jgi:hypothetical protein